MDTHCPYQIHFYSCLLSSGVVNTTSLVWTKTPDSALLWPKVLDGHNLLPLEPGF